MNLEELRIWLEANEVPKEDYSLNGGMPENALCIDREANGRWLIYYSERGGRQGLKIYTTEEHACDDFKTYVKRYWLQ